MEPISAATPTLVPKPVSHSLSLTLSSLLPAPPPAPPLGLRIITHALVRYSDLKRDCGDKWARACNYHAKPPTHPLPNTPNTRRCS